MNDPITTQTNYVMLIMQNIYGTLKKQYKIAGHVMYLIFKLKHVFMNEKAKA